MNQDCPNCESKLKRGKCPECGWGEKKETQGLPTWQGLPPYTKPKDDDPCGEWLPNGTLCLKTVREHIEEFRALCEKPNTVLSRPSQRAQQAAAPPDEAMLERRRQLLAEQARQLRGEGRDA